ncbi:hypothetical protein BH23ACT2_BH23ACT2_30250 [soil metagenome]
MNTTPKPSQIVIMASGAVTFLFSFFAFFTFFGESRNAWSGDAGTLFMATWPALFGLIAAGLAALGAFAADNVTLPDRVLTFTLAQVTFVLAFTSFVIMFGYLLGGGAGDGAGKGFGFILMLLGSVGLLVGAVMELLGVGENATSSGQSGTPPQSF